MFPSMIFTMRSSVDSIQFRSAGCRNRPSRAFRYGELAARNTKRLISSSV